MLNSAFLLREETEAGKRWRVVPAAAYLLANTAPDGSNPPDRLPEYFA